MKQHKLSLWCPFCGQSELWGGTALLPDGRMELLVTCPSCMPTREAPIMHILIASSDESVEALMMQGFSNNEFWRNLKAKGGRCPACGAVLEFAFDQLDDILRPGVIQRRIGWRCPQCGTGVDCALSGYCLGFKEVRDFWQRHARLQVLGDEATSFQGRHACAVRFGSQQAVLTIYVDYDTLELLGTKVKPNLCPNSLPSTS